jgi:tetratricopeptide (TPR) repeat protein
MLSNDSRGVRVCALALLVFATGSLVGCHNEASSAGASASAAPAPAEANGGSDPAKVLALASTPGDGATDKAIARAQWVANKLPSRAAGWISLGEAWIGKARETTDPGFYLNAGACADLALRASPDDPAALDLRALVLLNDHRFEEARALAAANVARAPDDARAYGALSDALLELGRLDDAASAAQAMMDLKPNAAAYSRAAHLRWMHGDAAGAERAMRAAIDATAPGHGSEARGWTLTDAAMVFWHQGDYDGAEAGFDKALDTLPDYPPALVGKARVLLARGEGGAASGLLARAYARSPLVETAWLLGDARSLAADEAGARQAYDLVERDGRRIDPRTLSLFESTKGRDAASALELAERERATRDDPYTEDAYAWALYRSGRLTDARRAIDAATRWGTPDARFIYHAGAIRLAQGERASGRALVARAIALNPKFDLVAADEAHRLIEGLHASR